MLSLWEDQFHHQINANYKSEVLMSPSEKVVTLVRPGRHMNSTQLSAQKRIWTDPTAQGRVIFLQVAYLDTPWRLFIHEDSSLFGMKRGLKEKNYSKATDLSLLSPSPPEATLLQPCEVEEVGKDSGADAAVASGLSVLIPHSFLGPCTYFHFPLKTGGTEHKHLFVYW